MNKTRNYLQSVFGSARAVRLLALFAVIVCFGALPVAAQQTQPIEPCTDQPKTPLKRVGSTATKDEQKTVTSQTLVDENIPDDPAVEKLIAPYSAKVRALANVIGRLDGELKKTGVGTGSLGNFVTDGLRAEASRKLGQPVHVMATNAGGMRKSTIAPGELRASDIFELLPFENALVKVEMTGQQLMRVLQKVLEGKEAQSGARIKYRLDAQDNPKFIGATLLGADGKETEIDPNKTYSLVTIDYLLSLKSGDFVVLQENLGTTPVGITVRDAMMEYVKRETAAGRPIKPPTDNRYILVGAAAAASGGDR